MVEADGSNFSDQPGEGGAVAGWLWSRRLWCSKRVVLFVGGLCHPHPDSALTQIANIMFDAFQIEACLFSKDPPGSQFSFRPVGNPRRSGIMQDAGPDDTTRLVTIFLGANDASLLEENPKQHVSWL